MALTTVSKWLEQHGRSFPEPDSDGSISLESFEAAGLPMVVACTHCRMTMVLTEDRKCDDQGQVYCGDCAEALEEL